MHETQLNVYLGKLEKFNKGLKEKLRIKQIKKFARDGIAPSQIQVSDHAETKKNRKRKFKRKETSGESQNNHVVNLSSTPLTEPEEKLLSRGLNFCPRPKTYDPFQLELDVQSFERRMRLKDRFKNPRYNTDGEESEDENGSDTNEEYVQIPFKLKSDYQPPPSKYPCLKAFLHNVKTDINSHRQPTDRKDNLSTSERTALKNLKAREDIVIKPADKGSNVVVMDKDKYIAEAERQLSDARFYKKVEADPTENHAEMIRNTLGEMYQKDVIDEDTFKYLLPENPKPGRFYLLPKLHKQGHPGRPIISANGHPTEKISEYIDFHLRPLVEKLPSHIKDTTDYLNKTPTEDLPENTILATLDVCSLYTSIPHDEGIDACREAWDSRSDKSPPTEYLVRLLEHILKLNNFTFNRENYLQVNGTVMGTKMAPSYANIYMGSFEKRLLQMAPYKPLNWHRFIDDIECKWNQPKEHVEAFMEFANSFHHSIKFTYEPSCTSNNFLDTKSTLKDECVQIDLHTKPTDSHQYLLPTSCHPKHITNNIPKGLAIRVKRICSSANTCNRRLKELRGHLRKRGYKKRTIDRAFEATSNMERGELLHYREKKKNSRVPFVATYHPDAPYIEGIIAKHWSLIEDSEELKRVFTQRPIVAYRRPQNLRDLLVRARVDTEPKQPPGTSKCQTRTCQICRGLMPITTTFTGTVSGTRHPIKQPLSCNSVNVIYLITCQKCGIQYIGETEDFRKRTNNHKSFIRNQPESNSVSRHFNSEGHTIRDLQIMPIESNRGWTRDVRLKRERYWMRQLKTIAPEGLNDRN